MPPLEDDEFGLSWTDVDAELDITWVLYQSEGAGLILGVLSAEML